MRVAASLSINILLLYPTHSTQSTVANRHLIALSFDRALIAAKRYVPAISGGSTAAVLTSGFDFQHATFCYISIVTIAIKCTVFELGHATASQTDRQTDRQTEGSQHY